MLRHALISISFLIALAFPVASSAWTTCGATSATNGAGAEASPSPSGSSSVMCHDTVPGAATDSGILTVFRCDHLQIDFDPSIANVNTGAEAQIYACNAPVASTTTCDKMLVDTGGDGLPDAVTLDGIVGTGLGRRGQQWQTAAWIFVKMTTAPSGSDIARTMVTCY